MRSSPTIVDDRLYHLATFEFTLYAFHVPKAETDRNATEQPTPTETPTDTDRLSVTEQPNTIDEDTDRRVVVIKSNATLVNNGEIIAELRKGQLLTVDKSEENRIWTHVLAPTPLKGHKGGAFRGVFTPDGKRIVTCGGRHVPKDFAEVKIWDAQSGKQLAEVAGHKAYATDVAISPDGRRIATASKDKTVRVWDSATQEVLFSLSHSKYASSVRFSPNGKLLASAESGYYPVRSRRLYGPCPITLWTASTGEKVATLEGHMNQVNTISFSPNGQQIASGGKDASVRIWDVASREQMAIFRPGGELYSISFHPEGQRIAGTGAFNFVNVWDVTSGRVLMALPLSSRGTSVAYSPKGDLIASGQIHGKVRLWNAIEGELQLEFQAHSERIACVAFSPDGNRLLTCSDDAGVTVWNIGDGKGLQGWVSLENVIEVAE